LEKSRFYNGPIKVEDGALEGSPVLAEPWTPLGTLDVLTDTVLEMLLVR
jgi:hypothetical protein